MTQSKTNILEITVKKDEDSNTQKTQGNPPRFSIFSPTHKPEVLEKATQSLKSQTRQDFEWIILLNGDALTQYDRVKSTMDKELPEKVKVLSCDINTESIGFLKKICCKSSIGDILVELDHDDYLEPTCLEELDKAFSEGADFVFTDCYEYRDGQAIMAYNRQLGWVSGDIDENGRESTKAFDPSPLSFSYIWYSPNHVRSWSRKFYEQIGGHDENLDVCDDHDIMARSYIHGKCVRIPKPLYNYIVEEGQNTCYGEKNGKIQIVTQELHDKYVYQLAEKWSNENELLKIDLASCTNKPDGYIGVDKQKLDGIDVVFDLDETPWPWPDNSVGVFRAHDALEHFKDPIKTMKEIYRCLAPYGWALIEVPSSDGRGAFQDPTHVSFWNENSFWYYTKAQQAHFIGTPTRFQSNRLISYFPNDWYKEHNIPYVKAHLVKLPEDSKIIPPHGKEI